MKNLRKNILNLKCTIFFIKFCEFFVLGVFFASLGITLGFYYYDLPLCFEASFGNSTLSTLSLQRLLPHNSPVIRLPGNLSLSFELQSSHGYEVCLDERAYSGNPVKQCLVFPNGTLFCLPEDGLSSNCLPPSLVKRASGTPVMGLSMFNTTSNTTFYVFMSPAPVKYRVELSEASSFESVWHDFFGCKEHMSWFAAFLVLFVLTIAVVLVRFVCCWYTRSRQKFKVDISDAEYFLLKKNTKFTEADPWEEATTTFKVNKTDVQYFLLKKGTKCTEADQLLEEATTTFKNPNADVGMQSFVVEVEVHDQHLGEVGDQEGLAPENDGETGFAAFNDWKPETNTIGTSRMILPHPTSQQSRDPSLYGSTSSTTSNGSALHSDVSSLSSRFSAIEETNTDVQPSSVARLENNVFEVLSQQEMENPDGGNV